jgi:hypothetical protein
MSKQLRPEDVVKIDFEKAGQGQVRYFEVVL